jgi:cytochrome c-type biogenesis protein CcmF
VTAALGRTLILAALLVSAAGAVVAFAAGRRPTVSGARWAERFAYAFAALMVAANLVMVYALLTHDFSVSYVAQVGSRALPTWVTIVSLWSSLEGSILFWGLVLGAYVAGATWATRERHPEYAPYAIGTWLACGTFFSFLIAGPAQPFLTVPNPPPDGPGPNPLLQNHILMAVHPPFLYLGYVGMTIPFGLAAAALLTGRLGPDFVRALRTWLLLPWTFLSVAIVLGGWWAYEVLGWGGYWAWDPVENASFLPWLTATAALHSALLMERKGTLKAWTVTLVMCTFLLTILGTFMTRSGVFNSVHSFTQSEIGPTILAFLVAALLFSVSLLALRVDRLGATTSGTFEPKSRESMFLVNNLLFVLFTFTVLIGTVFPLVVEAVRGVQMSVGRPYFDRMAVPIGVALLFLMGVGPALPWGRATGAEARRALLPPLVGAAVGCAIGLLLGVREPWTLVTVGLAGYTAQVTLTELVRPLRRRLRTPGAALAQALEVQLRQGRRRTAGYVVHAAVIVIVVAIAVSSTMGESREVQLQRGETVELSGYTLTFLGADPVAEPHRQALVARVAVERGGRSLGVLTPRMNYYPRQREPVGTPAVRSTWREDLYLSMVNADPGRQTLGLHAIVKPMVAWIWGATAVLGLAALAGLVPARRGREEAAAVPVAAAPHAATYTSR